MFKGCSQVSIGAGHQGRSQQNSFDRVREGNTKKETSQGRRAEEAEGNASAQTGVCLIELRAGFA